MLTGQRPMTSVVHPGPIRNPSPDNPDRLPLGVPWSGVDDVLAATSAHDGGLTNVTLIDPINPVEHGIGRHLLARGSVAEYIAARAPGARVVKAFNTPSGSVGNRKHHRRSDAGRGPSTGIGHRATTSPRCRRNSARARRTRPGTSTRRIRRDDHRTGVRRRASTLSSPGIRRVNSAHEQRTYGVRFDWGPTGAQAVSPGCELAIVIDVLSFTTTLSVALDAGITVLPYQVRIT